MTYNHILVAIPLSEESPILIEKAISLIKTNKGKVSLIHVDTSYPPLYTGLVNHNGIDETLTNEIKTTLETLADQSSYPISEKIIATGDLAEALTDAVERYSIDLVLCGHHQDFWSKLLSSARQIINNLPVDMLVVPLNNK